MNRSELQAIIGDIKLPYNIFVKVEGEQPYLAIRVACADDVCNVTKQPGYYWEGRRWLIEPEFDESQVVRTIFSAFILAMEHELREKFVYKGTLPFGPHFDINNLMAHADNVLEALA
jgi:hypothetical protein